jgi:putative tricarboxylic transport membrane protein
VTSSRVSKAYHNDTPIAVEWPGRHVLQRLLTMVVVLVVYAWGFEWLGFPLATDP